MGKNVKVETSEMSVRSSIRASERTSVEYDPLTPAVSDASHYDADAESQRPKPTWRNRVRSWWSDPSSGWRGGLIRWTAGAVIVLLLNIAIAIAIVIGVSWSPVDGIATAYTGDCKFTSRLNKGLHLLVNLLSTLLLGASNYCMQRLVAPTRQEVDAAHAQKKWLDIGIPGLRNLGSISGLRLGLWFLFGISSLPLHFIYNSVLFETQGKFGVWFTLVDPSFFTQKAEEPYPGLTIQLWQRHLLNGQYLNTSLWENITSDECISRYSAPDILSAGDGFGVPTLEYRSTHGLNSTPASSWGEIFFPTFPTIDRHGDTIPLDYCLSQRVPRQPCRLQFSMGILIVVIVCNFVKVASMIAMLVKLDYNTIVTVGDAVESFIRVPDSTTKNCCLASEKEMIEVWNTPLENRKGVTFKKSKRVPWFKAASWRRWIISLLLYATIIGIAVGLYTRTRPYCDAISHECSTNGFGNFDLSFTVDIDILQRTDSVILPILLANLPQAIIALVYLTYNSLFTAMLANREWAQYSTKRASLRVTNPSSTQRSTYFLSLPYTFSIPLTLIFVALHWLVSQSIFLARVDTFNAHQWNMDNNGTWDNVEQLDEYLASALGYSAPAILTTIAVGSAIVVACLLVGIVMRYPDQGMPLGGTNSAIISAACHVDAGEEEKSVEVRKEIVNRPLKWGITQEGLPGKVGHCAFSDGEVSKPVVGITYAGTVNSV